MLPNWHILLVSFNPNQWFTVEYSDTLLGAYLLGSLNGSARHRYTRHHRSSILARTNLEATAELRNSLVHALNADAHPSMCPRRAIWACGHSFALVPHFHLHFISLTSDADGGNA